MRYFYGFLLTLLTAAVVFLACSDTPAATVLKPLDFERADDAGEPFDRDNVIDLAAFTDSESLDAVAIQKFLARTSYDEKASFLQTYQSNGVRASDAVIAAARQHRINPIVFLVLAQVAQGLIGERTYPFPPERVEYVFGCGCLEAHNCEPSRAGFDRQVDCLAKALRTALDDLKEHKKTAGGWARGEGRTTIDNVKVSPDNDATAVLYERLPRVAVGEGGGTWLFWSIWNRYAMKLEYSGPTGGSLDGRWIGEPCVQDAMCASAEGAICATNYPDGMCTVPCKGECPSRDGKPETFCTQFDDGTAFCLPRCQIESSNCRKGYVCLRSAGATGGDSQEVCRPEE